MKNIHLLFIILLLFSPFSLLAQVEKVIVETYYVSDANDATDTIGGYLEEGSTTYRIYVDLKPGTKLQKIYGDVNHPIKIASTKNFFNNKSDGQTFAKNFSKNRYFENTVSLDSWLTLGQTSRIASKTYFGILKIEDQNGSFIGGINNDGGSAGIAGGLLNNQDIRSGIPVTLSDGFDTMSTIPSSWADYGIIDNTSGIDSTIFGSVNQGFQFISYNAGLQNSGVSGVNPDSNKVLIAQLTTKGDISFEINIEVQESVGTNVNIVKYVATDSILLPGEKLCPFLKYPPVCGCKDPNYLEYNAGYGCDNNDSCKKRIVYGCTDSMACNFDPEANFNLPELCCYPGFCNDRDLSVVCPASFFRYRGKFELNLFPNPSKDQITVQLSIEENKRSNFEIYNSIGKIVMKKNIDIISNTLNNQIDISNLDDGLYLFRFNTDDKSYSKPFIKY